MDHQRRMRILLRIHNDLLKRERDMLQALTAPLICSSCRGIDPEVEKNKLQLENSFLGSQVETLTTFAARLYSSRSLFPAAYASYPTWIYNAIVMTSVALDEVVTLARIATSVWTSNEKMNIEEYYSRFFPWYARNVPGFVHEASRASAIIPFNASSLVDKFMNPESWRNIFPSTIVDASMEFQHQNFQMINVAFMPQVSPLTQTRNVKLLRCSKRIEDNTWIIADISDYFSSYTRNPPPEFFRFPSGYLVQQLTNGSSQVTILDHWVYKKDQEQVNDLILDLGFGAQRSLIALQRLFYNFRLFSITPISQQSFDNLLKLSSLMVYIFCTGVCGVKGHKWERFGTPVNNIRMFSRTIRDSNGVPSVLVSATGLAKMQANDDVIFGLIKRAKKKDIWNYLEPFGDMKELIRIQRSHNPKNEISVFSFKRTGSTDWCLIQETYFEESGSIIIHAFVESLSLQAILNGGDMSRIRLLPCGLTIMKCGEQECVVSAGFQVVANQAMVMNSERLVNHMEKVVNDSLRNIQNVQNNQNVQNVLILNHYACT